MKKERKEKELGMNNKLIVNTIGFMQYGLLSFSFIHSIFHSPLHIKHRRDGREGKRK
jgi:hypothetical protein